MVVGVDAHCLEVTGGRHDRELLQQSTLVGAVLELDALARGSKTRPDTQVWSDVGGDGAVLPRGAVILGDADFGVEHIAVIGVHARARGCQASIEGVHVEVEDVPALLVDDVAGIREPLLGRLDLALANHRRGLEGSAPVGGAALQD